MEHLGIHTIRGRVVYNRRHRNFTGRDATRVVIAVNNNKTGNDVNWLAIQRIAWYNTKHIRQQQGLVGGEYDAILTKLLALGQFIVDYLVPIMAKVPGAGAVVQLAADLFTAVRQSIGK